MAKTAVSLSGNPNLKGVPTDFTLPIVDVYVSAGAGFIVTIAGEVIINKKKNMNVNTNIRIYFYEI